tara:strand:- start:7802 stop:7948 length:147 start_codon:yes stop_codon:yes gene_type:complete
MGKLFNMTTMLSVILALIVYFMVVAPMMVKKPANGNGNGNGNGSASRR